jgi:integrase
MSIDAPRHLLEQTDPQRSKTTVRAYLRRYQHALSRLGNDEQICGDLERRASTLSPATLRLYRAAYVHVWEQRPDCEEFIRRVGLLRGEGSPGKTSSQRLKRFSSRDLSLLAHFLTQDGHEMVALWLLLTQATGLRPVEWATVKIVDDWLVVRNAKSTHGRALGPIRKLRLDPLIGPRISGFLSWVQENYERRYEYARSAIYKATRELWPERNKFPTLYSCRHAFASVAKDQLTMPEVAVLMGHASPMSATRYYARRRKGGKMRVEPDPEALQKLLNDLAYGKPSFSSRLTKKTSDKIHPNL